MHLLLVDASGYARRAYHAGNPRYRESDGMPTGAVIGFLDLIWRMLGAAEADPPTHGAAVFDPPGRTFRYKLFSEYKANRGPRPEELDAQLPLMAHAAKTLGLRPIEIKGYEADDTIVTMAVRAKNSGFRVTVLSVDKDLLQIVEDGKIEVVVPGKGRMLRADVIKKFGVPPELMRDYQALMGDAVDNIPGVDGIGHDNAGRLIRRFGSLEAVLRNADDAGTSKGRRALKSQADLARLSYKLASLKTNVPLRKIEWDDYIITRPTMGHLKDFLAYLEAPSQLQAVFQLDPRLSRPVEHVESPFEWWEDELKCSGQNLPDMPQCGYYQRRLAAKPAPFVPASIAREREVDPISGEQTGRDILICTVDGKRRDPHDEWAKLAMNPISKETHDFLVADSDHAKRYRAGDPKAKPRERIDISTVRAPRNPTP